MLAIEYAFRPEAWLVGLRRRAGAMQGRRFWRGSQWLALDRRAADAVLHPDPGVRAWFERSWIPDETYIQTLLRITPGLTVADRLTTFVLDEPERPKPGWMLLSPGDLPAAWASGAAFFRKVDRSGRPEVVGAIDRSRRPAALPHTAGDGAGFGLIPGCARRPFSGWSTLRGKWADWPPSPARDRGHESRHVRRGTDHR